MIIRLDSSHGEDVIRVLTSNRKYQGTADFGEYSKKLSRWTADQLINSCHNIFGYVQDQKVIAFLDTSFCRHGFCLLTSSVDQNEPHKLVEGSRWPIAIIELVNYAVRYYKIAGFRTAWTIRPDNPKWVPYIEAPTCVLKGCKTTIGLKVPANTPWSKEYDWLIPEGKQLPVDNIVIKIEVC